MTEVTVVGTGAMGAAIALNLLEAGHEVSAWNRSGSRLAPLIEAGVVAVADLREIFAYGIVLSALANDDAVREVFLNSGALAAAPADAVHVNLATISPALAEEAATVHEQQGVGYVAAPMFGAVPAAKAGQLDIVTAGDPALVARVQPLLGTISARTWPIGESPQQANIAKVAGQVLIASAIQSMSEAITIGERAGLNATALVELFTSTITPGPVYTNYGRLIATQTYSPAGFTPVLGRKDIDLARSQADATGLRLPVADLPSTLLSEAIATGHEAEDWASLADVQRHRDAATASA